MTARHDLERRIADFYASEAPSTAPDQVLDDVLATIDITPQRRALIRVPWRFSIMNTYAKVAIAAVAVIAVGAIGLAVLQPRSGEVGGPTAAPSVATPGSPAAAAAPALRETFDSTIHGISVDHPSDWAVKPATEPWTTEGPPSFEEPRGDFLYDPSLRDHLFLGLASQPLDGTSGDAWAADMQDESCAPLEPVTIDGRPGVLAVSCLMARVAADGRGYVIALFISPDDPEVGARFDRSWFELVLGTVRLSPDDAIDRSFSSSFSRPFGYDLPVGADFHLGPDYGPTYFELRSPAAAAAGTPSGVIIQAVGEGRDDPCVSTSGSVPIPAGPQAVIDYLKMVPGLTVGAESATTVGGLPAMQAAVNVSDGTPDCSEIRPWAQGGPESLPGPDLRIIAVDVDGEHLVLTVYGEGTNPNSDTMVEELIGSIDFQSSGG